MAQNTVAVRPNRKRTFSQWINQENVAGVICTSPFIIGFFLFLIVPMIISGYYSFCDYDILSAPEWTGLDNFIRIFQDNNSTNPWASRSFSRLCRCRCAWSLP